MSAPQWVETMLAEHAQGLDPRTHRAVCACGWQSEATYLGEGTHLIHAAHVAVVLWDAFTARAQQSREDVAGAVHEADCGCLDWHPGDEEDHSYDIQANAAIAALLTAMGGE